MEPQRPHLAPSPHLPHSDRSQPATLGGEKQELGGLLTKALITFFYQTLSQKNASKSLRFGNKGRSFRRTGRAGICGRSIGAATGKREGVISDAVLPTFPNRPDSLNF